MIYPPKSSLLAWCRCPEKTRPDVLNGPHFALAISESKIENGDNRTKHLIPLTTSSPRAQMRVVVLSSILCLLLQLNVDPLVDGPFALIVDHSDPPYLIRVGHMGAAIGL
jgi:hypothetical protein